ncbi:DUF5690 family protein [Myroides sp. DF42-4-2]|uniref:DUF5690 family protein n=1 Tax=unclassified Myroides TaxID=2642485 RepID=UPI002576AA50|nr:DUF5690 family protein [Myroides sp. DF42-4-2]MDM1407030.1 hypothetical protein [Myroides sp. DF42-4-2]
MKGAIVTKSKNIETWFLLISVFLCYTGMYAVRKSFLAGQYSDMKVFFNMDPKILLVISQVFGYMISKFIGIKIVSEMSKSSRLYWLTGATAFGLAMLGLFAVLPAEWKFIALFLNGLPLGMIFGIVFSYIEGRKNTELLAAALSATFIFSTGFVKSVGLLLMDNFGVSEYDMPFLTGLLFFPLFLLCSFIMNKCKGPSEQDIQARSERKPMYKKDRMAFLRANGLGYLGLVLIYVILTIVRDFRDNFVVEFWEEQGTAGAPTLITLTEIPVALIVLVIAACSVLIKNNRKAFNMGIYLTVAGALTMVATTFLFKEGHVSAIVWMILSGIGVYLPYILFHCLIFERLVALLSFKGNVGFLFYFADSLGYFGSVAVLLLKEIVGFEQRWTDFFIAMNIQAAIVILLVALIVVWFFKKQIEKKPILHNATV